MSIAKLSRLCKIPLRRSARIPERSPVNIRALGECEAFQYLVGLPYPHFITLVINLIFLIWNLAP